MAYFEPQTTIYLCSTGIDAYNKPYFESNDAMAAWCIGKAKLTFNDYSYQRADERQYCAVKADYYDCLKCDTIVYKNAGHSDFWIIGNINLVEFKNPNTTWVWFSVDAFCTFCGDIDWTKSYSLVDREHVVNDWDGTQPNWIAMGPPDDFQATPEEVVQTVEKYYSPSKIVVMSPYDSTGQWQFDGRINGHVYTGLTMQDFDTAAECNAYLKAVAESQTADINNIEGIYNVPDAIFEGGSESIPITSPWTARTNYGFTPNNAKCYTSQYCMCIIRSSVGGTKEYKPELFDTSDGTMRFSVLGSYGASAGGIIVYPLVYNKRPKAYEDAFIITDFPVSTWVGNAYAQWRAMNLGPLQEIGVLGEFISGGVKAIAGAAKGAATGAAVGGAAGAVIGGVAGGISGIGDMLGSVVNYGKDMTAAQINGTVMGGTKNTSANLAAANEAFGFVIHWVMPSSNVCRSLDAYFDRFGYKVSRLKVPERNTRPCWNFVKTAEGHVAGDIPSKYRNDIEGMMNAGVTFWNVGAREIGDFSNPEQNKA